MNDYRLAYEILSDVYREKAFGSLGLSKRLDEAQNRAFVTKLVYGVLERDTECEYYLSKMMAHKPQIGVEIVLKIGIYCLEYLDNVPDYAAVNNAVNLCAQIGKSEVKGFVNGVLHTFLRKRPVLPQDKAQRLSVSASVPLWIVKKYIAQYGYEQTERFLNQPVCTQEHVRFNPRRIDASAAETLMDEKQIVYRKSVAGGYFVDYDKRVQHLYRVGLLTVQSLTSVLCCRAVGAASGERILDLCAAPGGKSVCMAQSAEGVRVVACDVRPHRVGLIEDYCRRMAEKNVDAVLQDALALRAEWIESFDAVLCDVPCSGLGVAAKKPDVYLNASPEKVSSLTRVQGEILRNGARYVKRGGRLIYSTCTLLDEENGAIVSRFVADNPEWEIAGQTQYLPDGEGKDGFYVAVLRNKGARA